MSNLKKILSILKDLYPNPECTLIHKNPLQLLVATILSAQCTDKRVNLVTPQLFKKYKTAASLADADPSELSDIIRSTGFFNSKTKNIMNACADIVNKHKGKVPRTMEELVELPGVGRKTANVVLGNAYGITSGIVVDTHVTRLSWRLGLSTHPKNAVKIERELCEKVPQEEWINISHRLILHGRAICSARKPKCSECHLEPLCPKRGVLV
jgi:endonuclease III